MKIYTFLLLSALVLPTIAQEINTDKNLFNEFKTILEKFEDKEFPETALSVDTLIALSQNVLQDEIITTKLTVLKNVDNQHPDFAKKYQAFCRVLAIVCYKKFIRSDKFQDAKMHLHDIKYVFGLSLLHILNTELADIKETLLLSHETKFFTQFNIAAGILFLHNEAKKLEPATNNVS